MYSESWGRGDFPRSTSTRFRPETDAVTFRCVQCFRLVLPISFSNWSVLVLWRHILRNPAEEWPPQRSQLINLRLSVFSTEIRGSRCAENFVCGACVTAFCSFAVSVAGVSEEHAATIFAYRTIQCIKTQTNTTQIALNNAQLKIFSRKLHTFSV